MFKELNGYLYMRQLPSKVLITIRGEFSSVHRYHGTIFLGTDAPVTVQVLRDNYNDRVHYDSAIDFPQLINLVRRKNLSLKQVDDNLQAIPQ